MDAALRLVRDFRAEVISRDYTDTENILTLAVRRSDYEPLRGQLARLYPMRFVDEKTECPMKTSHRNCVTYKLSGND